MKRYTVLLPITMSVAVVFDAEDDLTDDQAFEIAVNEKDWNLEIQKNTIEEAAETYDVSIEEFEVHEYVVQGNVFYGVRNQVEVESEELEGLDEE